MKAVISIAVALALSGLAGRVAQGSVQPQMYCWSPDVEFPIACEDDDEEEGDLTPGQRATLNG